MTCSVTTSKKNSKHKDYHALGFLKTMIQTYNSNENARNLTPMQIFENSRKSKLSNLNFENIKDAIKHHSYVNSPTLQRVKAKFMKSRKVMTSMPLRRKANSPDALLSNLQVLFP